MANEMNTLVGKLADLLLRHEPLTFTVLEIGAVPVGGEPEPFHALLDFFPGSRVIAFELDDEVCASLNKSARPGMKYYSTALGLTEETRTLYQTNHPMCSSLYEPNEKLIRLYNNFEFAYLKSVESVRTVSLDYFAEQNNIGPVDFIKIDIQGAELDVFRGGRGVLKDLVAIVCEVEFIPHYVDQPLFGDVCKFLDQENMMFHKFLGLSGRALAPIVIDNDPNVPTQHIWSDAVFIRDIFKIQELPAHELLKLSTLAFMYGSPDLTYYCLNCYDSLKGTSLVESFLELN